MTTLVLFLLIFLAAGMTLLAANLVLGWFIRPNKPSPEKAEVYECGEQPVGPAWVQFDCLRGALLFVIFDVELAFFFPWAVVFGSATRAGDESQPVEVRVEAAKNLQPQGTQTEPISAPPPAAARKLARLAFVDILIFFGVLLVGFAYLWRRGDLEWVRSGWATDPQNPQPELHQERP